MDCMCMEQQVWCPNVAIKVIAVVFKDQVDQHLDSLLLVLELLRTNLCDVCIQYY